MNIRIHVVEILGELADVFDRLDQKSVEQFLVQLLKTRKIFLVGSGRSKRMAQAFALRLMQLGLPAAVAGESTTGHAGRNDMLIAVSGSGQTPSVAAIAARAKKDGARLAVFTNSQHSPLARMANNLIYLAADGGRQYGGSLFEQSFLLLADAIAMELQHRGGLSDQALDRAHTNLE